MRTVSFEKIAAALDCRLYGANPGVQVSGVSSHSARVSPGDVFIAVKGAVADGHDHVPEAVSRGALAVVTERRLSGLNVCAALVKDSREAAARAACVFHDRPSRGFALVGVTGTNGKTTVCHLLNSVWERCGQTAGVIGTVEIRCGSFFREASMTTPGAVELQRLFSVMLAEGADKVCMEVSSHSISEKRVVGCEFDAAVFTNLTPEHLDYHGNMRRYAETKKKLFTELLAHSVKRNKFSIINTDDPAGGEMARSASGAVVSYSTEKESAEVFAEKFSVGKDGIKAALRTPWGKTEVCSNLTGGYNLSNILAAAATALCLGSSPEEVSAALSSPVFVPGRMERVGSGTPIDVFVDYAHTADALERVIDAVRPLCRGRMFVVFGCGGDRDGSKRAGMGRAASLKADIAVITSDNPRSEDPLRILEDIEAGLVSGGCEAVKIADRREAVGYAVLSASPGDLVLIAGKGHEKYQNIGGEAVPFDDRECAAEFLKQRGDAL